MDSKLYFSSPMLLRYKLFYFILIHLCMYTSIFLKLVTENTVYIKLKKNIKYWDGILVAYIYICDKNRPRIAEAKVYIKYNNKLFNTVTSFV